MTDDPGSARFAQGWLTLREPADRDARSGALAADARDRLTGPVDVHDLGSGTGSMLRWLAPRLPGPQRWVLHDHDPDLLARAAETRAHDAAGTPVAVSARSTDLRGPGLAAALTGATLVTASALLDLLTRADVDRLAAACADRPTLFTLSVTGTVELDPPDPLDDAVGAAFDAHQRRPGPDGRRLLGPDAVDVAVAALERSGARVATAASPWRLGPDRPALLARWLRGRVWAASAQDPTLTPVAAGYLRRRLDECASGLLRVRVQHRDLLALPNGVAR